MSNQPALKLAEPKALQPYGPNYGPRLDGMPLWARVMCVLGYHRWEERHNVENGRLRSDFWPDSGKRDGGRMRDQCGRCGAYR